MNKLFIITGSHYSGKTTVFEKLKNDKVIGENFFFIKEVASDLLKKNPKDIVDNIPNIYLQRKIFDFSKIKYWVELLEGKSYICDRWILDNIAYSIVLSPKDKKSISIKRKLCYAMYRNLLYYFSIKIILLEPLDIQYRADQIRNLDKSYQKIIFDNIKKEYKNLSDNVFIVKEKDYNRRIAIINKVIQE